MKNKLLKTGHTNLVGKFIKKKIESNKINLYSKKKLINKRIG